MWPRSLRLQTRRLLLRMVETRLVLSTRRLADEKPELLQRRVFKRKVLWGGILPRSLGRAISRPVVQQSDERVRKLQLDWRSAVQGGVLQGENAQRSSVSVGRNAGQNRQLSLIKDFQ